MPTAGVTRGRIKAEIAIVLALSFGASAVYAIVNIAERLSREVALSKQTATINRPLADRSYFDLTYQILGFAFGLAPVALVIFLLWRESKPRLGELGIKTFGSWRDYSGGFALAAIIGIPGIGFYIFAKMIGINATVVPTALDAYWWTVPVLILQALRAALGEELIVVAYLFNRFRILGFNAWTIIMFSAILRGTYHLYQGFGGFIGNVIMGVVFAWAYNRWGKVIPLIVAHLLLDIVSFVGYPLALQLWPQVFGV